MYSLYHIPKQVAYFSFNDHFNLLKLGVQLRDVQVVYHLGSLKQISSYTYVDS